MDKVVLVVNIEVTKMKVFLSHVLQKRKGEKSFIEDGNFVFQS